MKKLTSQKISQAISEAGFEAVDFDVSAPPKAEMGDWASNVALLIAGKEKKNPREVAELLISKLQQDSEIEKVEIAGPGFINVTLKKELYFDELDRILFEGKKYGADDADKKETFNVEYISANPTGPLHIGNARSGPIGEAIANLLEFNGHKVTREFYINDIGLQTIRFGRSLYHWYAIKSNPEAKFPEDGYPADYVKEISERIQKDSITEIKTLETKPHPTSPLKGEEAIIDFFAKEGLKHTIKSIHEDAALIGINFDIWSKESELLSSGKTSEIIQRLKEKNATTEKDGALWFKRPDDPELEDAESVLIKSDEEKNYTYFANDIAYHVDKIERGVDKLVDVWGANHFGHIPRMKASLSALDYSDEILNIVVYQYVRLKKSGESMSMGKRLGNFVTLRQVIEAGVEADAFKYFILSQNPNTPFDFDIELAADKSDKNPVYYIKYAHARIASVQQKAKSDPTSPFGLCGAGEGIVREEIDWNLLENQKEVALYKELIKFPELIFDVSADFQIQAIPHFAYKIAVLFNDFYESCPILRAEENVKSARIGLIEATKIVLKNSLSILGIEAPERM